MSRAFEGLLIFLGSLFALTPRPVSAQKIDRVVVFADRAEITRLARERCENGQAKISFVGLPAELDPRTLRAEGKKKAVALGTSAELETPPEGQRPEVQAAKDELKAKLLEIQELADRRVASEEQLLGIEGYRAVLLPVVSEGMRNPKPELSTWTEALDGLKKRRSVIHKSQVELSAKQRALELEESRLERQLQFFAASPPTAQSFRADVVVDCKGEAEAEVALSYLVLGARWVPEYDLHFYPEAEKKIGTGKVRLTIGALIEQNTGEPWPNVELVLSTAKPRLGAEAPELAPLLIDGYETKEEKVMVQALERRESLPEGAAMQTSRPPAELDDRGQSFTLTLPHRVHIGADGAAHWVPVEVLTAPGTSKLVTIPKLSPRVFQEVQLKNPAAYPLLAGRVHSYRRESFMGNVQLPHRGPGEPMRISLGMDDEIWVERKPIEELARSGSWISGQKKLERAYRIRLNNRAGGAEQIELRENIPVSKVDEIEVELDRAKTTTGFVADNERGLLTWTLKLASGEERKVDLVYTIKLPESWAVQ